MNEKGREWEEEEATWHFTQKKVNLQKYSLCDRTVAGMYSRFWEMKAGSIQVMKELTGRASRL